MPRRTRLPAFIVAVAVLTAASACASLTDAREAVPSGEDRIEDAKADDPGRDLRVEDPVASAVADPAPTTTAAAPSDPAPPTTAAPTTSTTTVPPPPAIEVGDLQSGVQGPRTRALQERLRALGYDPGPSDGHFGRKTTMAVWAFQALHGMARDGIVTPAVEQAILSAAPQQMLRPDLGPTHTEIDLDRQVLLVWGDGRLELVTHISSGSGQAYCEEGHCGDAVTPVGDYRYQRRVEGERHAPLGVLYNPVYFTGGIAVHGSPSVPNHPASHGCVRIPMHISEYFQSLVADGEPIATFRGGSGPSGVVAATGRAPEPAPAGSELGG